MGKLYKQNGFAQDVIGYFSDGKVTKENSFFEDQTVLVQYDGGEIYTGGWGQINRTQVARCDSDGKIYAAHDRHTVLAHCENGIVYEGYHVIGKTEIARYEGDMYGAAAAVAALMFGLAKTQSKPNSENTEQNDSDTNSVLAILGTIAAAISAFFMMLLAFSLTPLLCAAFLFIFAMGNPLLLLGAIGGIFVFVMRRRKKPDAAVGRKAAILQNAIWLICTLGGYFTGGILWLLAPAGTIAMFIYVAIATKRSAK